MAERWWMIRLRGCKNSECAAYFDRHCNASVNICCELIGPPIIRSTGIGMLACLDRQRQLLVHREGPVHYSDNEKEQPAECKVSGNFVATILRLADPSELPVDLIQRVIDGACTFKWGAALRVLSERYPVDGKVLLAKAASSHVLSDKLVAWMARHVYAPSTQQHP